MDTTYTIKLAVHLDSTRTSPTQVKRTLETYLMYKLQSDLAEQLLSYYIQDLAAFEVEVTLEDIN